MLPLNLIKEKERKKEKEDDEEGEKKKKDNWRKEMKHDFSSLSLSFCFLPLYVLFTPSLELKKPREKKGFFSRPSLTVSLDTPHSKWISTAHPYTSPYIDLFLSILARDLYVLPLILFFFSATHNTITYIYMYIYTGSYLSIYLFIYLSLSLSLYVNVCMYMH